MEPTISTYKEYYDVNESIRIYYTPREEGSGFDGEIIEVTGWFGKLGDWDCIADFEKIGQVHAHFDGIRHLYLGDNSNGGYIYYPELSDWHKILNALELLESKYCRK